MKTNLSWGQIICIMHEYQLPIDQVAEKFEVDVQDINAAIELWNEGVLNVTKFDVSKYGELFGLVNINAVISTKKPAKKHKILDVFELITTNPVDLESFMMDNDVTINILRQSKRFDKTGLGKVRIKNNKIWRELSS